MKLPNNNLLIVLFILVNLIIWGIFIIPNLGAVSKLFTHSPKVLLDAGQIQKTQNSREILERIDFYQLRDPFQSKSAAVVTKKVVIKPVIQIEKPNEPAKQQQVMVEKYDSRFRLKSIVQVLGKFMATLEEGAGDNSGYYQEYGTSPKSYMVMEGDSVLGEQVAKVTADYIILTKNGQFYKLTFSGGFSVKDAKN